MLILSKETNSKRNLDIDVKEPKNGAADRSLISSKIFFFGYSNGIPTFFKSSYKLVIILAWRDRGIFQVDLFKVLY